MPVTTPLPAEELCERIRAREERVDRGAAHREQDADESEQKSDLPERHLRPHRDRSQELGLDPLVEEERTADDHQREREEAAQPVPDERVRLVQPEILRAPPLLDAAGGVEVDLVGRHGGPQQPDREVRVQERALRIHVRDEAVADRAPRRVKLDGGNREDQQAETAVAEDALDPVA